MSIVGSPQWMYNPSTSFYTHEISQSCRFESGDSSYLTKTFSSAGNREKWTLSFWIKRARLSNDIVFYALDGSQNTNIAFNSLEGLYMDVGGVGRVFRTDMTFNDQSAWYHIVIAHNTTDYSTVSAGQVKVYVNGTEQSFAETANMSQGGDYAIGNAVQHTIGRDENADNNYASYYLAEMHMVNGSQLTASSFGETKAGGIWIPKEYTGSHGTNGFKFNFSDSSALGDDTSGNGNDFTASGLGADHQVIDSPTNNFSVLKIAGTPAESGAVLSQGNLKCESTAGTSARNMERSFTSTLLLKAGSKWYVEHYVTDTDFTFGLSPEQSGKIQHDSNNSRYCLVYNTGGAIMNFQSFTGVFGNNDSSVVVSAGDVVGMLVDMTVTPPKVTWSLNGQWGNGSAANQSNPTSFITLSSDFTSTDTDHSGDLVVWIGSISGGQATSSILNFGQDSTFAGAVSAGANTDANGRGLFKYPVPSDGLALCAANLPSPGIDPEEGESPTDFFDTVIYTGDGSSSREIDGLSFQPDWIWFKQRSGSADNHRLHDVVRGNTKHLSSDDVYAEGTESNTLLSFDNDGFTIGNAGQINENSQTFVAWNWKAGGSASSNSDGSITSSVSASQESGFSIVTYTGNGTAGATVGHGLGKKPRLIIVKNRDDGAQDWPVYVGSIGATGQMVLSSDAANNTNSVYWNNTEPTSSVFSLGTANNTNKASNSHVAYCFADIESYQLIGSFKGNGNADGPVVITGFRPAFLIVKRTDTADNWAIYDSTRDTFNVRDSYLLADLPQAEATYSTAIVDFLSNGFKFRGAVNFGNADGGTYLYLAIAEQPFKFANGA
tara:strand:+ start:1548 stop:4043 length:2496 start_codon:yes stop_codon:yes gene_type:complete